MSDRWRTDPLLLLICACIAAIPVLAVLSSRQDQHDHDTCVLRGGVPVYISRHGYVCYAKGVVIEAQP